MRKYLPLAVMLLAAAAHAAPADILDANKMATTGSAWDGKATLELRYNYSGQGLTGTTYQLEDLRTGANIGSYVIGPTSGANGFDGVNAWEKEESGTVTDQKGGDVLPLAYSGAYQNENLWWLADRGGAAIVDDGQKTEPDVTYDVLTVTPMNGTPFDAWFDAKTHLLARTVQVQSTQTITTFMSDYAPVDGVQIARKVVVDDGSGPSGYQTFTLMSARFLPMQAASTYARPAEHLNDYSLAGGATETTVPFQLVNNHLYADVSVNGGKPMPFIFDTGGHDILTPESAKALGVKFEGSQTSSGGGDALAQSGVAIVNSIAVGKATLTNQPVSVMSFNTPGVEGIHEGGMVGYEFFARFVTRIDYGNHTIIFIDKKHFNPKDAGTPVPIRFYHQFPEVLGTYDGIPARFGIDTGSRMPLMLTGPFAKKNDIRARVTNGAEAMTGWGVGGPSRSFVFRGGVLKVGDVTIDHPLTMISTDKGGAGAAEAFPNNIGGGVLKRFVVTFDYDHNLIYMKPVAGAVADLDSFDRSGLWINASDDGFKVIDVTKGGPAEAASIAKGDIITAVDGKPANAIRLYDMRAQLRNSTPGTVVIFAVKNGSATREVKVTLRDLI